MNHAEKKRRSYPRYDVKDVEGSFMLSSDIEISDMSLDGVGIQTHTALSVGRDYRLRIFRGGYPLNLTARVAWCRLVGTERAIGGDVVPLYRAGLQFDDIEPETLNAWQHFVGSKLPVQLEEMIRGHLTSVDDDGTDFPFEAEVVSLSGMRILVGPEVPVNELVKKSFPLEVNLGDKVFSNKIRVLNFVAAEGDGEEGFRVGLQWVELGDENRTALEHFISRNLKGARAVDS